MWHKITFELDIPQTLHLISFEPFDSAFPPFDLQYRVIAEEGVFYVSDTQGGLLAARLRSRGILPGDPVTIVKTQVANPNSVRKIVEFIPLRQEAHDAASAA
jgi:Fe2+ transport system protein FeoA